MPVRPSSLAIAKHCDLAPVLSERFPSVSAATERGSLVDAQVTAFVADGTPPTDPDARACVEWLCETFDLTEVELSPQMHVPAVCEGAAPGTADLLIGNGTTGTIVDYKKREQWDSGRLSAPDDNDQLHAYALGAGLTHYRLCLLLFGNGRVEPIWSLFYSPENTGDIMARIVATCSRQGPDPRGTSGDHCGQCYPRIHCPHWARRAEDGAMKAEPPADPAELVLTAKAMEEQAKKYRELARDIVDYNGPFRVGAQEFRRVMMPGKVTADVAALERDGLFERYSKVGQAFPSYRLVRPAKEGQ